MMKIIPITNLFLALSVIGLKAVYGSLHWFIPKLYAVENIDNRLKHGIVTILGNLSVLIILIAIISVIIGIVSVKEKMCNRILGIAILVVSCISFFVSLIIM